MAQSGWRRTGGILHVSACVGGATARRCVNQILTEAAVAPTSKVCHERCSHFESPLARMAHRQTSPRRQMVGHSLNACKSGDAERSASPVDIG